MIETTETTVIEVYDFTEQVELLTTINENLIINQEILIQMKTFMVILMGIGILIFFYSKLKEFGGAFK